MFKRKKAEPSLINAPQAGYVTKDPVGEFAEIYGSALVSQRRMFLLGLVALGVCASAVIALWRVSTTKVAIPWMVEVSSNGGVVSKPVKLESIPPNKAVIKAELAKWLTQVYTIDPKRTPEWFREANKRTAGKAIEQFRDFRVEEDVMKKMREMPDFIREVEVHSVDASQDGIAFAHLTTKESSGSSALGNPKTYRVTLHYAQMPVTKEAEIYANPLGLYVTHFNSILERR